MNTAAQHETRFPHPTRYASRTASRLDGGARTPVERRPTHEQLLIALLRSDAADVDARF
jgi:hypothetical protein